MPQPASGSAMVRMIETEQFYGFAVRAMSSSTVHRLAVLPSAFLRALCVRPDTRWGSPFTGHSKICHEESVLPW